VYNYCKRDKESEVQQGWARSVKEGQDDNLAAVVASVSWEELEGRRRGERERGVSSEPAEGG